MKLEHSVKRIKDICKDMKEAKAFGDDNSMKADLKILRKAVKDLAEHARQEHEDSAFFEKELEDVKEVKPTPGAHVKEEKEDSCDHVEEFRKRRKKRMDAKNEEDGRWVTTENDHKIHLNEEGMPDKGNPFRH